MSCILSGGFYFESTTDVQGVLPHASTSIPHKVDFTDWARTGQNKSCTNSFHMMEALTVDLLSGPVTLLFICPFLFF